MGLYPHLVHAPLFPELAGDLERIDAGRLPPGSLDTDAVDRAVMHAAERHGEFVAWFATGLLRAWFWLRCKRLAHGHAQIGSRRGIRLVATLLPISDCSKPNMERGRELLLCELQCAADDTDPRLRGAHAPIAHRSSRQLRYAREFPDGRSHRALRLRNFAGWPEAGAHYVFPYWALIPLLPKFQARLQYQ